MNTQLMTMITMRHILEHVAISGEIIIRPTIGINTLLNKTV